MYCPVCGEDEWQYECLLCGTVFGCEWCAREIEILSGHCRLCLAENEQ